MSSIDYQERRRQYIDDGFCIVENVVPKPLLQEMRDVTDRCIDKMSESDKRDQRSTGSLIPAGNIPQMAKLVTLPSALAAMRKMGFDDIRFTSGYIISKPPRSPPLFWHYDWMCWAHPRSWEKEPLQTFFMYYLVDTNRDNGCLRVIPGSHLNDHPLHDQLSDAHTPIVARAEDLDMPEFSTHEDEVDVPVRAGDLVIGDARLLHAAHANTTDRRRTVITLWMFPNFSQMPEPLQAFTVTVRQRNPQLPIDVCDGLAAMIPTYDGDVEPMPESRSRPKRPVR